MHSLNPKTYFISNRTIYLLFLLCLIIDFGGAFGIRYLSFLFVAIYLLLKLINGSILIPKNFLVVEGILFLIIPLCIALFSTLVYSTPLFTSLGEISSFVLWMIIYLILINLNSKEELLEPFKKIGFICSVIVIVTFALIYILIFLGFHSVVLEFQSFANEFRIGFIGLAPSEDHSYYLDKPNVYYRWTMILIPTTILFMKDNKLKFLVLLASVFIINSTGVILFTLLGLSIYLFIEGIKERKMVKNIAILFCGLLAIVLLSQLIDMDKVISKLSTESTSTSIKLGHIQSALSEILRNPLTFLFGTGVGTSFFSMGINEYTAEIEVSHINMIREFGSIYFLLFTTYVFVVFVKVMKTDDIGRKIGIGLISFFIAAGTNPLLLSPIFILFLIISKAYIVLSIREKQHL
jgi:hypothetical protein